MLPITFRKSLDLPYLYVLLAGLILLLSAHSAFADTKQTRLALVIGNSKYVNPDEVLPGAEKDAAKITEALEKHGFLVRPENNLSRQQMINALQQFKESLAKAGSNSIGFFYYAGHGGADSTTGDNQLIPVNTYLKDFATEGLSVQWIQTELQQLAGTNNQPSAVVVVLDTCRTLENLGGRGVKLVPENQSKPAISAMKKVDEPAKGFMFAFSTSKNQAASDEGDYARELIAQMSRKGLTIEGVFKEVQHEVYRKTGQFPIYQPNIVAHICLVTCEADIRGAYTQNQLLLTDEEQQATSLLETIQAMGASNRCRVGWDRVVTLEKSAKEQAATGNLDTAGETYKKVTERAAAIQSYLSAIDMVTASSKQLEVQQKQLDSVKNDSAKSSYLAPYRGLFKDALGNLANIEKMTKRRIEWAQLRQIEEQMEIFARAEDYINAIERAIEGYNISLKEKERVLGRYLGQPIPKEDRIQRLLKIRQRPLISSIQMPIGTMFANTPGAQACNN